MLRASFFTDAHYSISTKSVQNKQIRKMCKLIMILVGLCLVQGSFGNLTDFVDLDAIKSESDAVRMSFDQLPTASSQESTKAAMISDLKKKLNGQVLKVVTMEDPPLSFTEKDETGKLTGKGVAFQLFQFIMDKYNFSYTLVSHERNIIGSRTDFNGSLLEILYKKEADVAVAFLPILTDTRDYLKYSETTLDEGEWVMLMKRPVVSATGTGLLAPFTLNVWILILISLLIVGPMIYGLIILRYKLTRDKEQRLYPLPHCMWFVYGALMKQGSTMQPVADSTRMLFASWWIFITILTSFYTANLTAFLTLSRFTLPINTWDDLFQLQKPFVSPKGGCVEYAVLNVNESLNSMMKMYEKGKAVFTEQTDNETLNDLVYEEDFVLVRDKPAISHLIYNDYMLRKVAFPTDERKQCPFAAGKKPFMRRRRSFGYRHGFEFNFVIDPELLTLVETGIVKFMMAENLTRAEICPQNLGGTERQLRNSDLKMTYWIMLGGFCTAAVIFFTEIAFRFLNNRLIHDDGKIRSSFNHRFQSDATSVTPPPSYGTLFNRNKIFTTNEYIKQYEMNGGVEQVINGRSYIVFRNSDGEPRLVPIRTPSAALFQYAFTK